MKIEKVSVHADRKFNHPHESYSNLSSGVSLVASLDEGEDADEVVKKLQAQAEAAAEEHKQLVLNEIERLNDMTQAEQRFYDLQRGLLRAQSEMEALKKQYPQFALDGLPIPNPSTEPEQPETRDDYP